MRVALWLKIQLSVIISSRVRFLRCYIWKKGIAKSSSSYYWGGAGNSCVSSSLEFYSAIVNACSD